MRIAFVFPLTTFSLLLFFIFPLASHAESASLRAGFAQSAIWMSRSNVVAGESVNIFTVLYNSSDSSISGDVVIEVDDSSIGAKGFALAAGETQVVSLPWISKVGSHSISARVEKVLDSKINASTAVSDKTTGTITVSIEAPPPPSSTVQVLSTVASVIEAGIASSTPKVLNALTSLYNKTESLRTEAKAVLEKQVADGAKTATLKSPPKQENAVAENGQPGSTSASPSAVQASESFLSTAGRYAALAGLTIVSSKTLFYISLALVFLLIIQMIRVFFRERRATRRNRFAGDF